MRDQSKCTRDRDDNDRGVLTLPDISGILMRAIGVVHTNASNDEIKEDDKLVPSQVEIFPQFEEALEGLEEFSHVIIIAYLDRLRPDQISPLKVQPKRLPRYGLRLQELPLMGVFALDSPSRPNQIGLSQWLDSCGSRGES